MILIMSYKCRHCGEIFETSKHVGEDIDFDNKEDIKISPMYNKIEFIMSEYARQACPMMIMHKCKDAGPYGIADLISVDAADDDLHEGVINS